MVFCVIATAPETQVFHFDSPTSLRDSYTAAADREVQTMVNKVLLCARIVHTHSKRTRTQTQAHTHVHARKRTRGGGTVT